MSDRIASGEIYVDLNDGSAHRKLDALQAAYHRTMAAIDREEATATVDADLSKFDKKIDEAQKRVAKFSKEEAEVQLDANLKPLERALSRAQKELDAFEKESPKVELDAESARLKDQLRKARAELKKFSTEEHQARLGLDDTEFQTAKARAQAQVRRLDAESADIDVRLRGYSNLRKQVATIEKEMAQLNERAAAATEARAKAERDLEDAQKARARAAEASDRRIERAREKAANAREAANQQYYAQQDALEEQQYRRTLSRLKRESKNRDEFARHQEQTYRGLQRLRAEYDRGTEQAYRGVRGNYMRQLADLDRQRRLAAADTAKLQKLEEREITIRESLTRVTRKLRQFEQFRADDDRIARELEEVPKLEAAYNRLIRKREELDRRHRNASMKRDQSAMFDIELDARGLEHQIARMRDEVHRRTGREPLVFQSEVRLSTRAGHFLRSQFLRAGGNPLDTIVHSAAQMGEDAGERAARGFRRRWDRGIRGNARDALSGLRAGGGAIAGGIVRGADAIRRFGDGLTETSVRIGPFTTSVRKAVGGVALLSPIVVDVVGALGSLVAVTGSALAGVGALTTAIVGGGAPAFLGMAFVMKDVVQQFQAVKKAQKAYDDALLKGNTELAEKKLKELRATLGNVSAETARQVGSAQALGRAWDRATAPGRASIWKAIGQGIKTGSDLMPMFAKRTNESLNVSERGVTRWLQALRSATGKAVLDTMMGNFNKALGPTLSGLGSLVAYLGKVGAVASQSLPGLATTFSRWSKGLNDSADGSKRFVGGIHGVINSAKDVGNVFLSAGRLTKAFFGAGVRDGQKFSQTLSRTMDRWTAGFKSDAGRKQLQDFFAESVEGAKSLYHFLAPIAGTFVGWARALSPIARGFFDGAAAVTRFVQAIAQATAMQGPLAALAATMGTLWAIGKIGSAAGAIGRFITALFGIRGAGSAAAAAEERLAMAANSAAAGQSRAASAGNALAASNARVAESATAAAVAQARMGAAGAAGAGRAAQAGRMAGYTIAGRQAAFGMAEAAAAGAGAARAAGPVSRLARVGGLASRALSGLGMATIGVGSVMGGLAVAAAGAGVALYLYHNRTRESEKATKRLNDYSKQYQTTAATLADGNLQLAGSTLQAQQATMDLRSAQRQSNAEQRQLNKLNDAGKKGTREYNDLLAQHKQTMLQLASARLNDISMKRQNVAAEKAERDAIQKTVVAASNARQAAIDRSEAYRDEHKNDLKRYAEVEAAAKRTGKSMERTAWEMFGTRGDDVLKTGREMAAMLRDQGKATDQFNSAQQRAILANANLKRALQGLGPIAESHAKTFAKLGRSIQNALLSPKNGTKYADPSKAASTANAASRAKSAGVSDKRIIDIIVNSKSAEAAIRKLNALAIHQKLVDVKVKNVGDALAAIGALNNKQLNDKVVKILASDTSAKSKIAALKALGIPDKIARMLGNNKDALAKAAQANRTSLRTLIQQIMRQIANPGFVGPTPPPVTQNVIRRFTGVKGSASVPAPAAGTVNLGSGVETKATRNAQDRAFERASRGTLPRMSTTQAQRGQRFQGARMIVGEEPQYSETVISENPAYRKSNIEALKAAARALGVKMHAAGPSAEAKKRKKARAKPATDSQKMKAQGQARAAFGKKGKTKPIKYSTDNLTSLPAVVAAQRTESNLREQVDREAGILDSKEPDSFLKTSGKKTPDGTDIMEINQAAVRDWQAQLNAFAQRIQQLIDAILATQQAVLAAMRDLGTPDGKGGGVIGGIQSNIETLNGLINKETAGKAKAKSKASKQMADERIRWYKSQLSDQTGARTAAVADYNSMDSELNDIGDRTRGRLADAYDLKDQYIGDAAAVGEIAGKQLASDPGAAYTKENVPAPPDNPNGGTGDYATGGSLGPPTSEQALSNKLTDLGLEQQLADIGQGFKGQPIRTKDQINADKKSTAQSMIDLGNAQLSDSNPANDAGARDLISQGASALADLASSSSSPNALQAAFNNADTLKKALYEQFGSNVISRGGTIADLMRSGTRSAVTRGVGDGGGHSGDKNIYLQPTFQTQPADPHLWSRDVAFELQAAL